MGKSLADAATSKPRASTLCATERSAARRTSHSKGWCDIVCIRQPRVTLATIGAVILVGVLVALSACSSSTTSTPEVTDSTAAHVATIAAATATTPTTQSTTGIPPKPTAFAPNTTVPSIPTAVATRGVTAGGTPISVALGRPQSIIRFSAYQTNPAEVQIVGVRPDGTGRGTFNAFPGHPWGPRTSPDGTLVLFSSAAPASLGRALDLDLNGTGSPDLWVANADGSQARRLVEGTVGYNGWSWSPDGRWIAFASNRGGTWDIYKVQVTGTALTRLTTSPSQDSWPVWTSDGTGLVFASTRSDRAQLYRMDVSSGEVRRLFTSPTADTEPAIAPGGRIAFSAQNVDGTSEIYVLDNSTATPRPLTSDGGLKSAPSWSPDGTRLTFSWQRDGRSDLYVMNADGRELMGLTAMGQNQRPDWGRAPVDELAVLMQQLVARGESQRRTGSLEVTDDDGHGTRSVTRLRFDLGDQSAPPRIQRTTTVQGPRGTVTEEQIAIGDDAWQRQSDGYWAAIPAQPAPSEQVARYLPQIVAAQQMTADLVGLAVELRWDDPTDGRRVELIAGGGDGVPVRLRRVDSATGAFTAVVYDWNTPPTITAPIAP